MDTPSRRATEEIASNSHWYAVQPPAASTKRAYFIWDQVSSDPASGSVSPSQRSVSNPPARVPKARSFTPVAAHSSDIPWSARRSRRERQTWLETTSMPLWRTRPGARCRSW